jgi:hypothetical protein
MALGDTTKAEIYKSYLLNNYPESEYSKLITNPNYYKELKKKTAVLEVFYENTYRAYLNRQYQDVIERKEDSDGLFPNSKLAPKFSLLKAMAIGKSKTAQEFELALEDVIRTYPKDSVSIRAKEILDFMHGKNITELPKDTATTTSTLQNLIDSTTNYVFVPDIKQYFLVLYKNNSLNTPEVMNRIKSFNSVNYPNEKLEVKNGNIDLTYQYIMITDFASAKNGMDYYLEILKSSETIGESDPSKVFYFVVSQDNLAQLARSKNISAYSLFFQKYYLK